MTVPLANDRRLRRGAAVCLLVLLLTACGFQLQGGYALPEDADAVYVAYNSRYNPDRPPLVQALEQRLREWGVLGGPGADAQLVIRSVRNRRNVSAISPVDGRKAEYRVRSEVVYDYVVSGATLLHNERESISRHYSYNDITRLAQSAERRLLQEQLQQRLADRILFRLRHVQQTTGE